MQIILIRLGQEVETLEGLDLQGHQKSQTTRLLLVFVRLIDERLAHKIMITQNLFTHCLKCRLYKPIVSIHWSLKDINIKQYFQQNNIDGNYTVKRKNIINF
jgi:hypothetical protein